MAEIDGQKKAEIQKQAREILDNFSKALARVEIKKKEFNKIEGGFRGEGAGLEGDASFREIMFNNAPSKSGDSIIAEKKSW